MALARNTCEPGGRQARKEGQQEVVEDGIEEG